MSHADETWTPQPGAESAAASEAAEPFHAHEKTDAEPKPIYLFGVGLLLLLVGAIVLMAMMFAGLEAVFGTPTQVQAEPEQPPAPQLEVISGLNLEQLRAEEERLLNGYGWVDEEQEIVRIPVDQAMDLYLERGFDVAPPGGKIEPPEGQE